MRVPRRDLCQCLHSMVKTVPLTQLLATTQRSGHARWSSVGGNRTTWAFRWLQETYEPAAEHGRHTGPLNNLITSPPPTFAAKAKTFYGRRVHSETAYLTNAEVFDPVLKKLDFGQGSTSSASPHLDFAARRQSPGPRWLARIPFRSKCMNPVSAPGQ